jgi:hypothetical protein
MFKKIKEWFKFKSIVNNSVIIPTPIVHEIDTRDIETRKRVKKAFEAQTAQMQARALKAHDPSCKDLDNCKKRKCFKSEPDKIVSDPYEVPPRS